MPKTVDQLRREAVGAWIEYAKAERESKRRIQRMLEAQVEWSRAAKWSGDVIGQTLQYDTEVEAAEVEAGLRQPQEGGD